MKIGEFAAHFGVSKDTVRHYIEFGLLLPNTSGAQFQFNKREIQDMETILRLKEQQFSLSEIRKYLDILRVSTDAEPTSMQELSAIYSQKREELRAQIRTLENACDKIEQDIQRFSIDTVAPKTDVSTGVPLQALSLLACPRCRMALRLKDAELDGRYIYRGELFCECGYQAKIEDGIIDTGNRYLGNHDSPDLSRDLYRDINDYFVVQLRKCFDYGQMMLEKLNLANKVILEGHINAYFFLYSNIHSLDPAGLYIVTDKYPELLKMYKERISRLNPNYNILYLADASMNWPLKPHCVDLLINFMGDNEHGLYFKNFYIQDLKPYLADSAMIIGGAQGYHSGAKSLSNLSQKYPEGNISGSNWDKLEYLYQCAGYQRVLYPVGSMKHLAKKRGYTCHQDGEELLIGSFYAFPAKVSR